MEEKKKIFVTWVKKHKTELIIAGISVVAIIAVILRAKNNETLEEVWASLKKKGGKRAKRNPFRCITTSARSSAYFRCRSNQYDTYRADST